MVYSSQSMENFKNISISEVGGVRYLHLGSDNVQSAMDVRHPSRLVLAYTEAMMAWLLLRNDATHITHIGLGGGSLVRWISTHLPNAKQTVVEINPYIVAVAKTHFKLPNLDSRFQVLEEDGLVYVGEHPKSAEVLLVDAYGADALEEAFLQEDFSQAARAALQENGVLVLNWWQKDKRIEGAYGRLQEIFAGRTLRLAVQDQSNIIVLAFADKPPYRQFEDIKKRIPRLQERFALDFNRYFARLRAQNPHNDNGFLF